MLFYVKPNSNCQGLPLASLDGLLGGEWSEEPVWHGQPVIRTGEELEPRQVVGWSSLFGGSAVDVDVYRRIDRPALALVGGDWGLRILANDGEEPDPEPGAEFLPAGWGIACMTVYDPADIESPDLAEVWPA